MTEVADKSHQLEGPELVFADARTAFMLANYARKRAIVRAFGVSPEDANAITVAGLALIAAGLHETVAPRLRRSMPRPGDALIAAGGMRAFLGAIVGPTVDEMPGLGALIALALVVHGARPTAVRSAKALRTGSQRVSLELRHGFDFLLGRPRG